MKRFSILLSACYILVLFAPVTAFAHAPALWPTGYWGTTSDPVLSCTGGGVKPDGVTPNDRECKSLCDLLHTAQHIVYVAVSFLFFIITPIMLIYGAFRMLTSGGSSERVTAGRKIITSALVGLAIGMGAFLIINTFLWALGAGRSPTGQGGVAWPEINCTPPPRS